jgi:hypothetical protein
MRTSNWTPSIVAGGDDQNVYLVVDNLGSNGRIWREANVAEADLETVILDLLEAIPIQRVSIRHRPQGTYFSPSQRLSSVGSFLWILMRSMRFSIPKSVKAIMPSSPTP